MRGDFPSVGLDFGVSYESPPGTLDGELGHYPSRRGSVLPQK